VGLVFSPTTFGRSDELFLHLLVPISQDLNHLVILLGPYTLCLWLKDIVQSECR